MSLTPLQRAQVRQYLGFSDTSPGQYSRLEGAMDTVSDAGVTLIVKRLNQLEGIEKALETAATNQQFERVEDVVFAGSGGTAALYTEGNRLAQQIGNILGIKPNCLPYGTALSGPTRRG